MLELGAAGSGPVESPHVLPAGLWVSCRTGPPVRSTTYTSDVAPAPGEMRMKANRLPSGDQAGSVSRPPSAGVVRIRCSLPSSRDVTMLDVVRPGLVNRRNASTPAGCTDGGIGGIGAADPEPLSLDPVDDV